MPLADRKRLLNMLSCGCFVALLILSGCAFLSPMPKALNTEERLAAFPTGQLPLAGKAEIFWDSHQIPFIHASHDSDIPFLIGMVHAHLRLGQMELLRRVSQGRLTEMFGPFVGDIDHALRILDFGKAAPAIREAMPNETRQWLLKYVEGINHYVGHTHQMPPELSVLGIRAEPWRIEDVITLGRLSATDVNWLYWFFSLKLQGEPAWPQVWQRLTSHGRASLPSFTAQDGQPVQLLNNAVKSGSNSMVISGRRTVTGSALIANDPHLGLMLPNLWVILGYASPSWQSVGLTFPGVPMVLVGRNPHIAWGGTNMLALSSSLYDISGLNAEAFVQRRERLTVRWWFDREVTIRDSGYGPVISDAEVIQKLKTPTMAIKWRGHAVSDEFSAFLQVNRARNWRDFRQAFASYAVSGQNMLYADRRGNIGQVLAVDFDPAAAATAANLWGDPQNDRHRWHGGYNSLQLPAAHNPPGGFLVSTNNIPVKTDPALSIFGNSNDRLQTVTDLLNTNEDVAADDLKSIQRNVFSHNSFKLARAILLSAPPATPPTKALLESLRDWDGRYTVDSRGAAALELVAYHFVTRYYRARYGERLAQFLLRSPAVYTFMRQDLAGADAAAHLSAAVEAAADDFKTHPRWKTLHVLRLRHPLGNLPLLGGKYRFGDYPVPGSTNTVMKSAHPLSNRQHYVTYGANARHISDLSDLDENYFVLLGGQDGYWGSADFLDQFELWQQGDYVRVPLRIESVRRIFSHHMVLTPQGVIIQE